MKKIIVAIILILSPLLANAQPTMYAHFIDVGQGDATLLEFPCGAILIDAGTQDDEHTTMLVDYLKSFFQNRPDLNNTIDTVLITHNHLDHTEALQAVANNFTIKNYIDNGQTKGPGTGKPNWLKNQIKSGALKINVSSITQDQVESLSEKKGLTNPQIDPISCSDIDPLIRVLTGRRDINPGWSKKEFENKNNQSIAVRVDFGESSFLFTGDLEIDAIKTLLQEYKNTDLLDVDIYHVGHHGSNNATTPDLLDAMTPDIAVISMGKWDYGKGISNNFTTWAYGHPREEVVTLMESKINLKRPYPVEVAVAVGSRHFKPYTVKNAVYGTGWFGTVKIMATSDGDFQSSNINE